MFDKIGINDKQCTQAMRSWLVRNELKTGFSMQSLSKRIGADGDSFTLYPD